MKKDRIFQGAIPFIIVITILTFIFFSTSMYKSKSSANTLNVKKGILKIPKNSEDKVFFLQGEFNFTPNRFNCIKNPDGDTYARIPG